jgi:flagellin
MSLFSVNTNIGALAALQSLDQTQQALTQAQNEVSTGQSVSQASDNPAIYSIANTINANIAGLTSVSASLNFGAQIISTATSAITNINSVLQGLQQTVTDSGQTGFNQTTLQSAVTADLSLINQYAEQSTFNGVNLLTTSSDTSVSASNFSLNVVQGVNGSIYSVANQATALNGSATTLTDALGITGLNVINNSTTTQANIGGVEVAFDSSLSVGSFAPASSLNTTPAANTDAAFQITTGTGANAHTYSFEFTDDGATTSIPLQTEQNSSTTVVAVHIDSTKDSTNQITGALINALKSNGFGVVQNTDGSLNIVGSGVQSAQFGTVSAGTFTATSGSSLTADSTSGVNIGTLTSTEALVTTVQTAVTNANTIAANLGAASDQITGIQNFTTALSTALTEGVGALTDADLAAESAKLTSLQTKQQLATQSLSIANKQPQSLLTLFQGL